MKRTEREAMTKSGKLSYILERKQIKSMRLRVCRDGSVCVSAPAFVPAREIDAFVLACAPKVFKAVERRQAQLQKTQQSFQTGSEISVLGCAVKVQVEQSAKSSVSLEGGVLYIRAKDTSDSQKIESLAKAYLRSETEKVFLEVLENVHRLFAPLGVKMPQLRLREMKSLYGSCATKKGIITLNTHLLKVPISLIEYVAAHEMCHLLVPNHSKQFYALLERVMPDYKERKKELAKLL